MRRPWRSGKPRADQRKTSGRQKTAAILDLSGPLGPVSRGRIGTRAATCRSLASGRSSGFERGNLSARTDRLPACWQWLWKLLLPMIRFSFITAARPRRILTAFLSSQAKPGPQRASQPPESESKINNLASQCNLQMRAECREGNNRHRWTRMNTDKNVAYGTVNVGPVMTLFISVGWPSVLLGSRTASNV